MGAVREFLLKSQRTEGALPCPARYRKSAPDAELTCCATGAPCHAYRNSNSYFSRSESEIWIEGPCCSVDQSVEGDKKDECSELPRVWAGHYRSRARGLGPSLSSRLFCLCQMPQADPGQLCTKGEPPRALAKGGAEGFFFFLFFPSLSLRIVSPAVIGSQ